MPRKENHTLEQKNSALEKDIYTELQVLSWQILDKIGCKREPHAPVVRTRPWKNGETPQGVAYHYTGGPSGLKTTHWFNDPAWGNMGSSCHVLIFDRIPDNDIGYMWAQADPKLLDLFPVPALILADWCWGTYCTNWTNGYTLGVENRNCGYNIKPQGKYDIESIGKTPTAANRRLWEPYTKEQIAANINIGRLVKSYAGDEFDSDWVIGHSMVWSIKSDPGPVFPLHLIRHAITDDDAPEKLSWVDAYDDAPTTIEDDPEWEANKDERDNIEKFWLQSEKSISSENGKKEWVNNALYQMGYPCLTMPDDAIFRKFVSWFQQSTSAYAKVGRDSDVLSVDGDAGPKTQDVLQKRLKELRMI